MKVNIVTLATVVLLAGCAAGVTLPADPSRMTPQQISAIVRDKTASASCAVANGPWGRGSAIFISLDEAPKFSGTVTIGPDCTSTITVTSEPTLPKP